VTTSQISRLLPVCERDARGCLTDPAERAENTLARLAASAGPLRRVMAAIAARLIETRAHERLCFARLSDYAREQLGISARQLQELARVHRALGELPGLEQALVSNALPWSKARLIARVATREDELPWVELAQSISTRELERRVRAEAPPADPEDSKQRVSLRCAPALAAKWNEVRELAERVAGERLSAAEVLELVVAEAFSEFGVGPPDADPGPYFGVGAQVRRAESADEDEDFPAGLRVRSAGIPEEVLHIATGLGDANAHSLDRRLRRAIQLEQTLDAGIAPLLRVVSSAEHEWQGDYRTLSAYARDELGMSPRKARALLRLERVGDVCPELREAYRAGRLSWVKAQCLLPLLAIEMEGDWRQVWVDWAARVTVRRLVADVERALLLRAGTQFAWARCKFSPELVQDAISEEEEEKERQVCAPAIDLEPTQQLRWWVPVDVALMFVAVREAIRSRHRLLKSKSESKTRTATDDAAVFEALLDHAISAWTLREPGQRRPDPVIARDGYRCLVPGCTSRKSLHDHHVVFRSAGGSDAPANRVTLCAFHHQRGVHAGRMQVLGSAPARLEFVLPTGRYASGDVRLPGEAPELRAVA
jgi:hypothetical protein